MTLLIAGLILWTFAHYFKRLFPAQRASMGDAGKAVMAAALLASVVLMVIGYRAADFIPVWQPPAFLRSPLRRHWPKRALCPPT